MTISRVTTLLPFIAMACFAGCLSTAADEDNQWEVLFDGTSTDAFRGWKKGAFPEKGWHLEDGTLRMKGKHDRNDLITKKAYRDFDLRWEWKATERANSGVMYRVSEDQEESFHTGPEYQLLGSKARNNGSNKHKRTAASLYDLIPCKADQAPRGTGQWNTSRIVIQDSNARHYLNDELVVEYVWGGDAINTLIAKSKFKKWDRFMKEEKGHIAFQNHDGNVWFRNIRIKDLSAE